MADVLSNYRPGAAFDEMIDAEGSVRPSYQAIHNTLSQLQPGRAAADRRVAGQQLHPGRGDLRPGGCRAAVPAGPDSPVSSPRTSGRTVETGVPQRVRALEMFLADVYGGRAGSSMTASSPADW